MELIWTTEGPLVQAFQKNYIILKNKIIAGTKSSTDQSANLYELKCIFGNQIRSVRQVDAAKDVKSLIYLLEKRLELGWFNVESFKHVLKLYSSIDSSVHDDFNKYREKLTEYKIKHKDVFMFPPYDPEIFSELPNNMEVLPPNIFQYICTAMGNSWRHFGRELVSEELLIEMQLDDIRDAELTNQEKTELLLNSFLKGEKRTKRSQLLKLLRAIHRNDIEEEISNMFTQL